MYLFWNSFHHSGFIVFLRKSTHSSLRMENMPQEEKDKIKILPLCRNIGKIILLSGIIFLMKGLWTDFSNHWFVGSMVAWLMIAGVDVWYITKSERYKQL